MGSMQAAVKGLEQSIFLYLRDLEVLPEEQILACPGGVARTPVDFTYEVAFINRRIAARFRGVEPPPMPESDGWLVAPEELRSKAAIIDYANAAFAELVEAVKSVPEEEANRPVGAPGKEEPAYEMANFAAMHTMYHDAQLNYVQALNGDSAMHWS